MASPRREPGDPSPYIHFVNKFPVYFLTWTTYGTWLHGDPRYSVDDEHNTPKTDRLAPDPVIHSARRTSLRQPPVILDEAARSTVHGAIESHAAHRGWHIHALNVRSNHVHVVVSASTHTPEVVMGQFKQWSSRLLRDRGNISHKHIWTRMGSTRWIRDTDSLAKAIDYVLNHQ